MSSTTPMNKTFCTVNGYNMAYVETNDPMGNETMIFLHGNPTSSYLWRNIMAPLAGRGRLIAPDLIGMGDSDKLNNSGVDSYKFEEHVDFLDKLLECVIGTDTNDIVLVIHDWGSALGFWWAYRFPERIKGIAYMEAIVMPLEYDFFPPFLADFFGPLRTPGVGEALILEQNFFIEQALPQSIIRTLTQEELDVYRAPYLEAGEDCRPTLTWPREVPFNNTPANVAEIVGTYSAWMGQNEIPKLFVQAIPGTLIVNEPLDFARTWKNQVEVSVPGIHFIQEDSPDEIAEAIGDWLDSETFSPEVEAPDNTTAPMNKTFCTVNGYNMAYVETNDPTGNETMIFLHGNPTSSYLWRNIMAPLAGRGRLIAPDLIGMGDSDKLNNSGVDSYKFEEHVDFLDKLLECVIGTDTNDVILVIHDWGSALGFWWAYRFPERIKGIAYMEAIVMPLEYDFFPPFVADFFGPLRTPGVGEALILEQNIFIEQALQQSIIRTLTKEEIDVYRAPYLEAGEDRRPTLTWPREVPFNNTPANVAEIVGTYSAWMSQNLIPKLFVQAIPGTLIVNEPLDFARTWKNQVEVTVAGIHFIQEDSPDEIAEAIGDWLDSDMFAPGGMVPTTSSPASMPPATTAPITTSPVAGTAAPITMSPIAGTAAPFTSEPFTMSPVTTAPITAAPVATPTMSPVLAPMSGSISVATAQVWFVVAAWLFRMIW